MLPRPPRSPASGHVTAAQVSAASGVGSPGSLHLPARESQPDRPPARPAMASSSVPPASAPPATATSGPGFGFASKTKKKHFVQQKVKVFRAADPLVGVFLWGVAHSVRPWSPPEGAPGGPHLFSPGCLSLSVWVLGSPRLAPPPWPRPLAHLVPPRCCPKSLSACLLACLLQVEDFGGPLTLTPFCFPPGSSFPA